MSTVLVDLNQPRKTDRADVPNLGGVLAQLIGEPFLLARLGYAEELTVHFGTPRPAQHPRLRSKGVQYGSHVLALCASAWVLKSTPSNRLILEGLDSGPLAHMGKPAVEDAKALIASGGLIPTGSPVVAVVPYEMEQANGIGLRLETADGSGLIIVPGAWVGSEGDEADVLPEGAPDLPDWELRTPSGLAQVGPGRKWSWSPSAEAGHKKPPTKKPKRKHPPGAKKPKRAAR